MSCLEARIREAVRFCGNIQWLPPGWRRKVVRWFYPLENIMEGEYNILFKGLNISVNLSDFIDNTMYFYGDYENVELDLLDLLSGAIEGCISFDVGANTGFHTLILARKSRKVYSFEPLPLVSEIAKRRVKENGFSNVVFIDAGLAECQQERDYYFNDKSMNRGMGSFDTQHDLKAKKIGTFITLRGDEWVDQQGINRVDLIKIDVEGFESNVLIGFRNTISQHRPVIMIEYTESTQRGIDRFGGIDNCIPYPFELYEVTEERLWHLYSRLVLYKVAFAKISPTGCNLLVVPRDKSYLLKSIGSLKVKVLNNSCGRSC